MEKFLKETLEKLLSKSQYGDIFEKKKNLGNVIGGRIFGAIFRARNFFSNFSLYRTNFERL